MIHQVYLPEITYKRLTDIVVLQVLLLNYAATRSIVDKASCATYLDQCARFRGRGNQIAAWIWRAPSRYGQLEKFAGEPSSDKCAWSIRICREVFAFLHNPIGDFQPHIAKHVQCWERAGAEFLRRFYDDLCRHAGFPNYIFSEPGAGSFGKQDFLRAFIDANKNLYVCASCDGPSHHESMNNRDYMGVDHHFPRSTYPHFSCHPFNLVPICSFCNETFKGSKDPLRSGPRSRRRAEEIFLPYREAGLGSQTYLQVRLRRILKAAEFSTLEPRVEADLGQRIKGISEIYKIPSRWRGQVEKIGEELITRRLQRFLEDHSQISTVGALLKALDEFLCRLYEDQGKEVYGFVKLWWIVTLINQAVEPATRRRSRASAPTSPLLNDLGDMLELAKNARGHRFRGAIKANSDRLEIARNLRKVVQVQA